MREQLVALALLSALAQGCASATLSCDRSSLLEQAPARQPHTEAASGPTLVHRVAPGPPIDGVADAIGVAVGGGIGCAALTTGGVACWRFVQAAPSDSASRSFEPKAELLVGLKSVKQVAAGRQRHCALHTNGQVSCWQFGAGAGSLQPTELRTLRGIEEGTSLTMHYRSNTGYSVLRGGQLRCFGDASIDGLGFRHPVGTRYGYDAVERPGLSARVAMVALSQSHVCSMDTRGAVRCWGWGYPGAELVPGLIGPQAIHGGDGLSCGLMGDDTVRCWGAPGRLGDGSTFAQGDFVEAPRVIPALSGATSLSIGNAACALLADGTARCWGRNNNGSVGDGTRETRFVPVPVCGLRDATAIAAGDQTCALLRNGRVYCWGYVAAVN